ncbi:MAG: LysM peptidoglycan-binding domain-containing protein [Cyclobacteriaceae bacterium]|nr:LysM peptidoglycan-binding domain-containing protein [Cyclobacteriaceae bacterium]
MKKIIFLLLGFVFCGFSFSQSTVEVPSRMMFADVKLKITEKGRKAIQEEVDRITRSPKYFNAKVSKADIHFPLIEEAFKEEGVSTDFKYLSLQESALIPDAVSTSNAVGYWQFKDFTAIQMGLRVDKHIDERMNIYASSRAAARYMKKNNEYFDNWIFALQAYQMGAGAAMKVVDEKLYGAKSMTITDKTYWYVRTFLAHKIAYETAIGKNKPSPELILYKSGKGKTLHEIAKETNLDLEIIRAYNKWLIKGKVPSDKVYEVILPSSDPIKLDLLAVSKNKPQSIVRKLPDFDMDQSNKFPVINDKKQYSSNSDWRKINGIVGVLAKEKEAIRDLAVRGNLDISKFLKYNDITIDHYVTSEQVYYYKKKHNKAGLYYHVVQPNEDLWSISQKYGIQLSKLLTKNRMRKVETVKSGRVLWLRHIRPSNIPIEYKEIKNKPVPLVVTLPLENYESIKKSNNNQVKIDTLETRLEKSNINKEKETVDLIMVSPNVEKTERVKHEVRVGETLYGISKTYNVDVMDIVKWNNLNLTEDINAGQWLTLYTTKGSNTTIVDDAVQKYTVKPGDTMYKIAREHNVSVENILYWNNKKDHRVSVGEILMIKEKKNKE